MDADVPGTDWRRVLVVVAHPDDESFALGALIDRHVRLGAEVSVLCLTRGEASTLGAGAPDLATVRESELADAARALGCAHTTLLAHPDGGLAGLEPGVLEADVEAVLREAGADGILVLDPLGGVTGHPDHRAASLAAVAVAARHGIPVLGWAIPDEVSEALNADHGAAFVGHPVAELTAVVVDRRSQLEAVHCHVSQAVPGSVLWQRLRLLGDLEYVRVPAPEGPPT
jgi:N-acetylglucosamine malate deacetylase 2